MSVRLVARLGLPRSPARRFMIGSFIVHLVFTVALVAIPALRKKPQRFDNPIRVQLSAPAPTVKQASPPAVKPTPPRPQPKKEPEGVRIENKIPKPKKDTSKEIKTKAPPDPEPEQEVQTPAPGAFEPAVEDPVPGAVVDPGGSVSPMEGGDEAFAWYRASVTAALHSNWQRPFLSGLTQSAEVRVVFEILRDGQVRGLQVENSSGIPSLDRSALRAVSDASPLPPLPPNLETPTLLAGFVFRLHPD